ncbi:MAG: hypothetical protein FJ279_22485, partial [Planctomycetes bacterium]|nr:hypothetical protein [Planctomycetota bacterium]
MSEKAHRYLVLASLAALLLGPRLGHLSGPIDDPHSWRQCDTANYAWAFYKEGIDLFRPSVCWMGAHKTVILEFPLHEAVVAVAYRLLGYDLLYARLVTLAFFAGAAVYLFLLVRFLFDRLVAVWATAIYLVLPLGIFYSRAVHIDFCAVGLAHAMLYYWTRGYAENKPPLLAAGTACGVLAFLVKAPYAFYLLLPLGCLVAMRFSLTPRSRSETSQHEGHEAASSPLVPSAVLRALHVLRELRVRHDGARRAACLLAFVAVPLLCFLAWRMH